MAGKANNIGEIGITQIGPLQLGGVDHSSAQVRAAEIHLPQIGLEKLFFLEIKTVHIGADLLNCELTTQLGSGDGLH